MWYIYERSLIGLQIDTVPITRGLPSHGPRSGEGPRARCCQEKDVIHILVTSKLIKWFVSILLL